MVNKVLTRRELRQQKRQKTSNYRYLKKGSAVVGTALVTVSVVAPLLNTQKAEAVEDKTITEASNVDKKAFINEISKEIQPLAEKHDLYASVMIAQAILESNWGQNEFAQAPYHNLFGLEGQYQGQSVILDKQDVASGQTAKKELKKYGSYKEAIQDYIEIIKTTSRDGNENYFSGTWRSNAQDYQTAAAALAGRFTDDQNYVDKLISTIEDYQLASYDATEPVVAPVAQAATTSEQPKEYTVQSGDTVNSITDQFSIGIDDFVEWNNVTDNNIYAGQTVIVGQEDAKATTPTTQTVPAEPTAPVENLETVATPTTNLATPIVSEPSMEATNELAVQSPVEETTQTTQTQNPEQTTGQSSTVTPAVDDQTAINDQATSVDETPTNDQAVNTDQTATNDQATSADQTATNDQTTETDQTVANDQTTNTDQTQQTSQGQQVVNEAEKYIGTDYVWGGKTPDGFDCSGLTQYVYKQVTGKDIGSWTVAQESSGTQISVSQAQQGDLLFWGDQGSTYHVAISAGGDQYIHAPQPGEQVTYGSTQYYTPDFGVRVY